jgi:hypothetical protein
VLDQPYETRKAICVRDEVYSVHATRPGDTGAVEIVFRTEREAIAYAKDRSTDWRVLAASVTRFTIGELGPGTPWPGSWTASSNRLALLDQAAGSIQRPVLSN